MERIIEIRNLYKYYGDFTAVDDLSFSVEKGELFAFLGVNGAGKSTTIGILCGQIARDGGSVLINGKETEDDMDNIRNRIGVVFQNSVLDSALSVYDNLMSRAALYGLTGRAFRNRLEELAEMLEFSDILKKRVSGLSGGQRRKIDVARALLHSPEILILDEPTTGLDPQTRKNMWNVIEKLRREEKMTVLLTTHYMEEAADADYVVIINSGKKAAEGTPVELKNTYSGDFVTVYGKSEDEIKVLSGSYEKTGSGIRFEVENTGAATEMILSHPELFDDYEITKGKMDDVFLAVTGIRPEEGENI